MCATTAARTASAMPRRGFCPAHAVLLLVPALLLLLPWGLLLQPLLLWAVLLLRLLAVLLLLWTALLRLTMPLRVLLRCSRTTATEWLQQLAHALLRFTNK